MAAATIVGAHHTTPVAAEPVLILSSRALLTRKYGERGFLAIAAALRELASAIGEGHALVAYVDDERSLRPLGAMPVSPRRPDAIRGLIEHLERSLNAGRPATVCLVGGGDVVPFFRIANPADDPDGVLMADAPYACSGEDVFRPLRAVSRLPDQPGAGTRPTVVGASFVQSVLPTLRNSSSGPRASAPMSGDIVGAGYTASVWREAAQDVFSLLIPSLGMRMSPPWTAEDYRQLRLPTAPFRYYNLHGKSDGATWYGQRDPMLAADYAAFPVALRAHDITAAEASGTVVVTEACYGASLEPGSMASRFLSLGGSAFLGSTAMAYGAITPPVTGADLLAKEFLRHMLAGSSASQAHLLARTAFSRTMMAEQGFLDAEDQKTVLSFILLGNPCARVQSIAVSHPSRTAGPALGGLINQPRPDFDVVCARSSPDPRPLALQPSLMEELEFLANSFMSDSCPSDDGIRQGTCNKMPMQRQVSLSNGGGRVISFRQQLSTGATRIARFTVCQGRVTKAAVSR